MVAVDVNTLRIENGDVAVEVLRKPGEAGG
jgi:hypothetical protein